MEKPPTK